MASWATLADVEGEATKGGHGRAEPKARTGESNPSQLVLRLPFCLRSLVALVLLCRTTCGVDARAREPTCFEASKVP